MLWGYEDWGRLHRGIRPDLCRKLYMGTPTDGPERGILKRRRNVGHFSNSLLVFSMAKAEGTYLSSLSG